MSPIIRNVLAVVIGLVVGSLVNMGILSTSATLIPPPTDADVTTMEGLKATMHLFEPKHFIMPFLAHAFGTFAGAFLAALLAHSHKMRYALAIGLFFLIGGIANVILLPSPVWFTILDLAGAYLPMAYLAGHLASRFSSPKHAKA